MGVVRWQFNDPITLEQYQFEINPNSGGSPAHKKNIQYQQTLAGKTLIFEGTDETQTIQFSGTLLSQAQHDVFLNWFKKRYQVYVTDDLGREFTIYITSFTPTRVRSATAPWKQTYVIDATVL